MRIAYMPGGAWQRGAWQAGKKVGRIAEHDGDDSINSLPATAKT
jgi:hypothetical protein